ncbi:MAG: aminotransferase class I/II-fold pyridoxal phosphate-dependent enzyme [Myxococcota bacterium]
MSDDPRSRLDAAFDPEQFRIQGHRVIDELTDYLSASLRRESDAVLPWKDPAQQVAEIAAFSEEPSEDLSEAVADVLQRALRQHDPRCMGHQDAVPLPAAALATLAASLLNNDPSTYEIAPGAVALERRLLRWTMDEIGYPATSEGILTSGGSLGNLTALLAARQSRAGFDLWDVGDHGGPPLCVLVSSQIHYCVGRAVQMMGWGHDGAVTVPVDDQFRLQIDELPGALERAQRAGRKVVAVVASAGTTASGSFDQLEPIADFCEANGLWLHVDGAHGASAILSPTHRHLVAGIERADSVVWDAHKMMMMPSLMTMVLFRDGRHSYQTFRQEATYLFDGRPEEEWYNAGNRTVECTRPAMSVRLHTALRVHGIGVFREYVTRCFDLGLRFGELIEAANDFELAVVPQSNIVCFRYAPSDVVDLDALQGRVRKRIVHGGRFFLVDAELNGELWLRTTLMNPLTDSRDLEQLLDEIRLAAS